MQNKKIRNRYNINVLQTFSKKQDFYIFKLGNLNNTNYRILKNSLNKKNIEFYKIKTSLIKVILKKSIFQNLRQLLEGPILLIHLPNIDLLDLETIEKQLIFLGYKLQNNFYSASEIKNNLKLNSNKKAQLEYLRALQQNLKKLTCALKLTPKNKL